MKLVGLTGGIACGKSTVADFLKEMGTPVVDADIIARTVVEQGKPAYHEVVKAFGPAILDDMGSINRGALGQIVFNDHDAKKRLESIVHHYVWREMLWQIGIQFVRRRPVVVLDVPLLFETRPLPDSGWKARWLTLHGYLAATMVVYTNADTQLARLMHRNQLSREDALSRIQSQMSSEEKRRLADFVIDNSGDREHTRTQCLDALCDITGRHHGQLELSSERHGGVWVSYVVVAVLLTLILWVLLVR